jgi:hypothetical protein
VFIVGLVVALFVMGLVQYHAPQPWGTVVNALAILTWVFWPSRKKGEG